MICEVCREKNAEIVFKTVTGNQVATKAMCMSCAHNMQQDMIKMFIALGFRKDQIDQTEVETQDKIPTVLCVNCGRPYDQLSEQTMAGCAVCYEAMREDLKARMAVVEPAGMPEAGKDTTGKQDNSVEDEVRDLRYRLMEAVTREEFEEAAALRDRIALIERVEEQS